MERKRDWGNWDDLSVSEKIERVQEMWDDLAASGEESELTPEQLAEIERREVAARNFTGKLSSWAEVRRRLEHRT